MKRAVVVGVAAGLMLGAQAGAAQEANGGLADWVSGSVAVTNDYVFRGISQTLQEPAIQGGLDLAHPNGLYLGVWGSSVNFGEDLEAGPRAQMEFDVYGGFGTSLFGLADVDLGATYYAYPGAEDGRSYDFLELGLGVSRDAGPLSTSVSLSYSPDFFAGSGQAFYYGGEVAFPVSFLTLSGSVGRQTIAGNEVFGTPDYLDWGLGVGATWSGVEVSGRYVGTDLAKDECFGGSELCHGRVVLSIGRGL